MISKEWQASLKKSSHTVLQVPKVNNLKEQNVHFMLSIHPLVKNLLWVVGFAEMLTLFRLAFFFNQSKTGALIPQVSWKQSTAGMRMGPFHNPGKRNNLQCKKDAKYHVHNSCCEILTFFEPRHQNLWGVCMWPLQSSARKHWTFTNKQLLLKDLCVCGLWMMLAFRRKKKYWLLYTDFL